MNKPLLLEAFEGTNASIPVWFMRQAGRYLPEYQAIKSQHSLEQMFQTPELAAEITCQPIDILGVDAAILFADILTLPQAMGFEIGFDKLTGPKIKQKADLKDIHDIDDLSYVEQTIGLIKKRLNAETALIGFAGSPFTVLTYLIEGGSSNTYAKTLKFIAEQEEMFSWLMDRLTKNTIDYLKLQQKAGIDVFQIFDTWASILPLAQYEKFVLPFLKQIFEQVDLPSIYFAKNSNYLLPLIDQCGSDFLSMDHTVVLGDENTLKRTSKGVQGNLFNGLLYADDASLKQHVNDVLVGGAKHKRFIFNLSHGVLPNMDVDKLKLIVGEVHSFNHE